MPGNHKWFSAQTGEIWRRLQFKFKQREQASLEKLPEASPGIGRNIATPKTGLLAGIVSREIATRSELRVGLSVNRLYVFVFAGKRRRPIVLDWPLRFAAKTMTYVTTAEVEQMRHALNRVLPDQLS